MRSSCQWTSNYTSKHLAEPLRKDSLKRKRKKHNYTCLFQQIWGANATVPQRMHIFVTSYKKLQGLPNHYISTIDFDTHKLIILLMAVEGAGYFESKVVVEAGAAEFWLFLRGHPDPEPAMLFCICCCCFTCVEVKAMKDSVPMRANPPRTRSHSKRNRNCAFFKNFEQKLHAAI